MMATTVSRTLRRWRWSAQVWTNARDPRDTAGDVLAGSSSDALERIAIAEGCAAWADSFEYWHTGGHGRYRNTAGDEVTIVVVEITGPR